MKRTIVIVGLIAALATAGAASAYALSKRVTLAPGRCKTIHHTKVCARKVQPKTITVSPSPVGKTFSGSGSETLVPFTVPPNGTTVKWTSQPYSDDLGDTFNVFGVSCGLQNFDNGNGATTGSSFLPAGTYTCDVVADDGGWTISF